MARDHARIYLDIWTDDDFRDLSSPAQWLYLHLLTSQTLTFAGVADWRPARIASHTAELTAADVEHFGTELQDPEFILVDPTSEEVLIRSFVKHDGLMRSPNMAKALARDHGEIASAVLRAVLVGQMKRLRTADPDLKGWPEVATVLAKRSMTFKQGVAMLASKGSGKGSDQPSRKGLAAGSGTPFLPNSLPPNSTSSSSSLFVTRGAANG